MTEPISGVSEATPPRLSAQLGVEISEVEIRRKQTMLCSLLFYLTVRPGVNGEPASDLLLKISRDTTEAEFYEHFTCHLPVHNHIRDGSLESVSAFDLWRAGNVRRAFDDLDCAALLE